LWRDKDKDDPTYARPGPDVEHSVDFLCIDWGQVQLVAYAFRHENMSKVEALQLGL
jgi:hypothetical protein